MAAAGAAAGGVFVSAHPGRHHSHPSMPYTRYYNNAMFAGRHHHIPSNYYYNNGLRGSKYHCSCQHVKPTAQPIVMSRLRMMR